MADLKLTRAVTSQRIPLQIRDLTSTTGGGLTGLAFNSSGLKCSYARDGDASETVVTLVSATFGTYTSSGFVQLDATNAPGDYELDLPDAAFAQGNWVKVKLWGANNMTETELLVQLVTGGGGGGGGGPTPPTGSMGLLGIGH